MEKIPVEIKAKYREYNIGFSEWDNQWSVEIGEEKKAYSNTDIKKVKEYVDKIIKSEFKPIKILLKKYSNDEIVEATLSSLDSESKERVWVISAEGNRSKEDKNSCFALTDDNLAKIKQMDELDKKMEGLHKENVIIYKSLKKAI